MESNSLKLRLSNQPVKEKTAEDTNLPWNSGILGSADYWVKS